MRLQFNAIAQSDLGLVRDGNEDSALISGNLIAVADGMGGHAGGEVASAIAINTLQQLLPVISDKTIDQDSRADLFLIARSNSSVKSKGLADFFNCS